jgi:uncharacterized coiled-coil DUF342 family protein
MEVTEKESTIKVLNEQLLALGEDYDQAIDEGQAISNQLATSYNNNSYLQEEIVGLQNEVVVLQNEAEEHQNEAAELQDKDEERNRQAEANSTLLAITEWRMDEVILIFVPQRLRRS